MKVRTFLALLIFVTIGSAIAETSCNDHLIKDNEQCRITFKKCMANPIFSSLCAAQLDNCTKTANTRASECTFKQQDCMNAMMDRHDICQSNYYQCAQDPGKTPICASDLDSCSDDAETNAKLCVKNIFIYLYNEG